MNPHYPLVFPFGLNPFFFINSKPTFCVCVCVSLLVIRMFLDHGWEAIHLKMETYQWPHH